MEIKPPRAPTEVKEVKLRRPAVLFRSRIVKPSFAPKQISVAKVRVTSLAGNDKLSSAKIYDSCKRVSLVSTVPLVRGLLPATTMAHPPTTSAPTATIGLVQPTLAPTRTASSSLVVASALPTAAISTAVSPCGVSPSDPRAI